MKEKLELMSTEALTALRDAAIDVLKSRKEGQIRTNAVAWFIDKSGNKRYCRITRRNRTTVSAYEVDEKTHQRLSTMSWKVSPALLNPVVDKAIEMEKLRGEAVKRAAAQKIEASRRDADKPVEDYGDAW